jgi:hypothetical protein
MRVRIDETRSNYQSVGIDCFRRTIPYLADLRDQPTLDRDVGNASRRSGSIHHRSVFD